MAPDDPDKSGKELAVGYCNPPAEHRFRKGRSGNPNGRPKRAKQNSKINLEFGMQPAAQFLRQEAYRPIAIREGDRVIELPTIQAVFRAMGVSAMKGNRFAQRTLAEMMQALEGEEYRLRIEHFGAALDYKIAWEREFERCRAQGKLLPEPLPHPDDIILDPNTGGVKIRGPQTREQKEHYDLSIARRDIAQQDVTYYAWKFRRARNPEIKAWYLEEWQAEQRMFDSINDLLGKRYQVELQDRCYEPGSSRKGDIAKKHGIRQL
jgi:hypothetical protein